MLNNIIYSIAATITREMKRMIRRPIYFLGTVGVMGFTYLFFLTFFNEGQPNKMPIAVVDMDNSSISRQFIRNLKATQQAEVVMLLKSHREAREEMQKGKIYGFVEIKKNFSREASSYRRPTLTFYVNDGYLVAGSLLLKDFTYMSNATSLGMERKVLRAKGMEEYRIMGLLQPIALDTHLIGNPWANYGTYLLNVILPGILQLMVLLMTIYAVGIELKLHTSHEWLANAGNSMFAALTGKLIPYTVLFTAIGIIGNLLLYRYMHYPMNSSIGWMFLAMFMLVVSSQCIATLLIGIIPVLRDSITIAGVFGVLGVTFAGATFPIEQMPSASQIFSHAFPINHYFSIYVNQELNGVSASYSAMNFVWMLAFCVLPFFVFGRLKHASQYENFPTK
jgi:ABC-2 type transport system permease protein